MKFTFFVVVVGSIVFVATANPLKGMLKYLSSNLLFELIFLILLKKLTVKIAKNNCFTKIIKKVKIKKQLYYILVSGI